MKAGPSFSLHGARTRGVCGMNAEGTGGVISKRPSGTSRPRWVALLLLLLSALLYLWYAFYWKHHRGASDPRGRRRTSSPTTNASSSGSSRSSSNGPPPSAAKRRSSSRRKDRGGDDDDDDDRSTSANLPSLIMLMGIPGSGKSTWAKQYVFKCDASFTIVSSDDVRKQLCNGDINDQSRNAEVWEVVLNQVQGLLKSGRNVLLDGTNTHTDRRRRFVKQLPPCKRYLKVFQVHRSIAKDRIARDLQSGVERSNVPDSVLDRGCKELAESMEAVRDEHWRMKS